MIEIGKYNDLKILRQTSVGLYLGDGTEDVLLPNKYCPEKFEIDDVLSVFVYLDYAERKIATNITPKINLHEFALLQVSAVTEFGAFMDWGLEKELLVPFKEQNMRLEEGRWYIVYLDLDTQTDRLYATNKIEKRLQNDVLTVAEKDEVDLVIYQKTDMGYTVIVNHQHKGLVFENEIFRELRVGDKLKGYIRNIREDNKLDISLSPIGYERAVDEHCDIVFKKLAANQGFMNVTDKTSPEEIYLHFGMSKKAFKKAIGSLYKDRVIEITPDGIKLISN
ncbi:MAG: GntR family transcriptional regulator [Bacteroidetes bacterium HGW-Bacteroidetes-21]|nr:MAG: GntR family transcriptional regulator [Bacteroidetes bacterium HGW-Bacteroidetes-21]